MKVVNVRINGMENPVGFDFETVSGFVAKN